MLLHFLYPFVESYKILNLLRYITFRAGAALLTALLISFVLGNPLIRLLKRLQKDGQPIRDDGPASHMITKKGTPTMGGFLILISLCVSTVIWGDWHNQQLWIVLGVTLGLGILGGVDDYLKLKKKHHHGLRGKYKLIIQGLIAILAIFAFYDFAPLNIQTLVMLPFVKNAAIDLHFLYIPFAMCVMIGASNAVNLTDGLDGLAIVPVIITALCLALISYVVGHSQFATYLHLSYIPHGGELAVFLSALVGSGLGFLWFNAPPARVFMGDTGSLSVGGALGCISVFLKHEIVLAIIGGLFVIEAVSVIVQVLYYKATKKRVFLMAPIHHHFEKKGWAEATIVIRFWIISAVLGLIGLSSLKIR